jgi:hypothetical protein
MKFYQQIEIHLNCEHIFEDTFKNNKGNIEYSKHKLIFPL